MTIVQMQQNIRVHCEDCGHFRTRHVKHVGCLVCNFLASKKMLNHIPCKNVFKSRLPQSEIDQAVLVAKDSYPGRTRCATCLEIWWAHEGMLCPNGETLFVPLIEGN